MKDQWSLLTTLQGYTYLKHNCTKEVKWRTLIADAGNKCNVCNTSVPKRLVKAIDLLNFTKYLL